MSLVLAHTAAAPAQSTQVFILPHGTTALSDAAAGDLSASARHYADAALADDHKLVHLNHFSHHHYFVVLADKPTPAQVAEALRRSGHTLHGLLKAEKIAEVFIQNLSETPNAALLLAEGLALSAYQFEGYKTDEKSRKAPALTHVYLVDKAATAAQIHELDGLLQGVLLARDLVNAPLNKLNAVQFAERMAEAGDQAGYTTDILDLAKIEALRMGGLLAVNLGSPEPPTFSILEYKPANAKNAKPYVLVGKGVVFDTGGLSLKPTPNSMDMMKCDMAGGAAVAGTLYALAKNEVPLHVILRGIEKVFDLIDKQPNRKRTVKSLLYCKEEIEAQFAEWLESQIGSSQVSGSEFQAPGSSAENQSAKSELFSDEAIKQHLETVAADLEAAQETAVGDWRETLERVLIRLAELAGSGLSAEKLEESLEKLDALIDESLLKNSATEALKTETEKNLASYRDKMEKDVFQRTFDLMLLKKLREQSKIPRLSLFYL